MADFTGPATFGGILVNVAGGLDAVLGRFDGSGNASWMRVIGGTNDDDIRSITSDKDGNCLATGSFQAAATIGGQALMSSGGKDVFISKYAADGTPLWTAQAGGIGDDVGNGIVADLGGGLGIVGECSTNQVSGGSAI